MDNMVVVWIRVSVWLVVPYDVSVLSCGNTTQSLQVPIISPTGGNLRILSLREYRPYVIVNRLEPFLEKRPM